MTAPTHPRVAEVARLLDAAGATGKIRSAPTVAAAAEQLGVPVGAITNSLIFDIAGAPRLVLTSGAHRVDQQAGARLLGVPRIERATPEFVREHTGQAIGGVSPIGRPAPIGTLVDMELAHFDTAWAAAGHPHIFPTSDDELLVLTGSTAAEVGTQR